MMFNIKRVQLILVLILLAGCDMASVKEIPENRLAKEKSPYLLQHAHNPVDWYPWGDEAFERARKENKPIFLSIGYSTCHWCHVMARESFSDPETAEILNKYYISIKVDREERPDIDKIYMKFVSIMTGRGGWPLTVFMTPDKKPFYGGTYFPPEDRWGRPGLKNILRTIIHTWENDKKRLLDSAEEVTGLLVKHSRGTGPGENLPLDQSIFGKAYEYFKSNFDPRYGGFTPGQKFPTPHNLLFLLRYWKDTGDKDALNMVRKTLDSMADGGIYDHLGGGFHRYSTDAKWRIPHFEKMLYDQALISRAYLEAYQATGNKRYKEIAGDIFEYILRDMTSEEGGFFTAEDADSYVNTKRQEKKEGAFYLWERNEIIRELGREKGEIFSFHFGIEKNGNALSDPHGELKDKNVLYDAQSLKRTAKQFKKSEEEVEIVINKAKVKLFNARAKRIRPGRDDKILLDWNGLMISSLAFGSIVLDEPRYKAAAEKSADFILNELVGKEGRLLHSYRNGASDIPGNLDDYAFFILGLFDLYEATFDYKYLARAKHLTVKMIELFWDETGSGFFFTGKDTDELIIRQKEIYDGALPSGNSVAVLDLLLLGRLTMEEEFEKKAELAFKAFSTEIYNQPYAHTEMLVALNFSKGPSKEIVIAGDSGSQDVKNVVRKIYSGFIPNKVLALSPSEPGLKKKVRALIPFITEYTQNNNKTTVYICQDYACTTPITELEEIREYLK